MNLFGENPLDRFPEPRNLRDDDRNARFAMSFSQRFLQESPRPPRCGLKFIFSIVERDSPRCVVAFRCAASRLNFDRAIGSPQNLNQFLLRGSQLEESAEDQLPRHWDLASSDPVR